MFNSQFKVDGGLVIGTVLAVDIRRFQCSIMTESGRYINKAVWLSATGGSGRGGVSAAPGVGDRVMVSLGTGSPVILGCLPRVSKDFSDVSSEIESTDSEIDTHGETDLPGSGIIQSPGRPSDLVSGDQVFSVKGGGLFGILRDSTFLARANKLCQFLLSPYDSLARLVTRNFERFSDSSVEVHSNGKAGMYSYKGYSDTFADSKDGNYAFEQKFGNVAAARENADTPSLALETVASDGIIFEENVGEKMIRTYNKNGTVTTTVTDGGIVITKQSTGEYKVTVTEGSSGSVIDIIPNKILIKSDNGTPSSISITGESLIVDHNNKGIATFNESQISLSYNSKSNVVLTESSASMNYDGQGSIVFNSDSANMVYGDSAKVTLKSDSAIVDFGGTSNATMTSSGATLESGGHTLEVGSSGVLVA